MQIENGRIQHKKYQLKFVRSYILSVSFVIGLKMYIYMLSALID